MEREHLVNVMRGDWRTSMRREVDELGKTINYLHGRGVNVLLIYPPSG